MPLPKISTPTYELELPSTQKTVRYRPFLVKEEKVLLIALESENTKEITMVNSGKVEALTFTNGQSQLCHQMNMKRYRKIKHL